MAVGKITGPGKATKQYSPIATQLAEDEFKPALDDVDTRASNRARNLGLFNASVIDALAPYIQRSREASEATTQYSGGFGIGSPNLMAALQAAGRVQGANQQGFNNQIPFHVTGQFNRDRLMSEKAAGQERRDINSQMATRRGQILQSLVDGLFRVQSQRYAQDLTDRQFNLDEDKFGESKRATKVQERLQRREARLNEKQQAFAEQLALDTFDKEYGELGFKERALVLSETESKYNIQKDKKDAKANKKGKDGMTKAERRTYKIGLRDAFSEKAQSVTELAMGYIEITNYSGDVQQVYPGDSYEDANGNTQRRPKAKAFTTFKEIWNKHAKSILLSGVKPNRVMELIYDQLNAVGFAGVPTSTDTRRRYTRWVQDWMNSSSEKFPGWTRDSTLGSVTANPPPKPQPNVG